MCVEIFHYSRGGDFFRLVHFVQLVEKKFSLLGSQIFACLCVRTFLNLSHKSFEIAMFEDRENQKNFDWSLMKTLYLRAYVFSVCAELFPVSDDRHIDNVISLRAKIIFWWLLYAVMPDAAILTLTTYILDSVNMQNKNVPTAHPHPYFCLDEQGRFFFFVSSVFRNLRQFVYFT